MELQIGEKYQCRLKEYIACVTDDVFNIEKIYRYKGYVFDANTGAIVRKICMWTSSGNYSIDHQTDYDIISILKANINLENKI